MASGDLVKRPQLDSSGIEEGAQKAAKALGTLKKYSELAEKGLKSLGNADGLKNIKDKFSDLSRQIDKFSTKMNNGLNIKQQKKQIELQLDEVAAAYRSLSKEEQSSAEGKWLKNYMNELTVMGGKAADTIQDMNKQINAMASDTPILAGLAEATSLVTNGFTIAKGAAHLLGMDEKELAKVQKELTSLMAINNAVMNIKNALVNQGAIKTAVLNIKIKANTLLTAMQAAATTKAGVAAKSAAMAQVLWNNAIKAHPFVAFVTVVGAVAGALYKLIGRDDEAAEAAKRHEEAERKRKQELMNISVAIADNVGKQIGLYKGLQYQWKQLTSEHEKNQWIKDNKKLFDELGVSITNTKEAEDLLVNNSEAFVNAMVLRGKAMALQQKIQEEFANQLKREAALDYVYGSKPNHKAGETVSDVRGLKEGLDYKNEGYSYTKRGNGVDWASTQQVKVDKFVLTTAGAAKLNQSESDRQYANKNKMVELSRNASEQRMQGWANQLLDVQRQQNENNKTIGKYFTTGGGGTTKTTKHTTATNDDKKALENSLAWFDEEINKRKEYQLKFAIDHKDWQRVQDEIEDFERRKILKQIELEYGGFREALGSVSKGFENAAITGLKSPEISKVLTGITMPNWEEINADAAEKKMNAILKKTEGLRMVANAAGEAFGALGQAIGDNTAGKVVDFAGMIASSIAIMVEGYARATAAAGKLSPWAWLAFGLTGAAQLAAMIAQVRSFDTGGIVGGNGSFSAYNDGIVLRAHQGEMMLNKQQQRKLFDSINGGLDRTHNGNVTFTIKGKELVGVLNNYNETFSRTR